MTLKELQDLVNNVNTMGFEPEQVEVQFKYYFADMKLADAKSEVKAGKDVTPVVVIDLR
jgi:hypothetical protein